MKMFLIMSTKKVPANQLVYSFCLIQNIIVFFLQETKNTLQIQGKGSHFRRAKCETNFQASKFLGDE